MPAATFPLRLVGPLVRRVAAHWYARGLRDGAQLERDRLATEWAKVRAAERRVEALVDDVCTPDGRWHPWAAERVVEARARRAAELRERADQVGWDSALAEQYADIARISRLRALDEIEHAAERYRRQFAKDGKPAQDYAGERIEWEPVLAGGDNGIPGQTPEGAPCGPEAHVALRDRVRGAAPAVRPETPPAQSRADHTDRTRQRRSRAGEAGRNAA